MVDKTPAAEQTDEEAVEEATKYWNEAVSVRQDGGDAPAEDVEHVAEEPAEAPDETETPKEEPEAPESPDDDTEESDDTGEDADTEEPDEWASVPEHLRKEHDEFKTKAEKYEHEARSNRGRLGALQREINELSRKLEETQAKDKKAESPVDPGDTIFDFPEWKQFEDDFGDVAKPQKAAMRRLFETLHSRLQDTDRVSQELQNARQNEVYEQQANVLEQLRPGWLPYVQEHFNDMQEFAQSDPALKTMWDANFEAITNAKQADRFFKLYDLERGVISETNPASAEAKPKPEPRQQAQLSSKRQQQLKSAASIAPRSHPAPGRRSDDLPDPDEYDASFRYFEELATR